MMTMNATPYRRVDGGEEICLGTWGEQRSGEMIWSPLEVVFSKTEDFWSLSPRFAAKYYDDVYIDWDMNISSQDSSDQLGVLHFYQTFIFHS